MNNPREEAWGGKLVSGPLFHGWSTVGTTQVREGAYTPLSTARLGISGSETSCKAAGLTFWSGKHWNGGQFELNSFISVLLLILAVSEEIRFLWKARGAPYSITPFSLSADIQYIFCTKVKALNLAKACAVAYSSFVAPWQICSEVTWLEIPAQSSTSWESGDCWVPCLAIGAFQSGGSAERMHSAGLQEAKQSWLLKWCNRLSYTRYFLE